MSAPSVGGAVARADAIPKVTGGAVYTADIEHGGQLHAAILRSPVCRGRLLSVNVDKAREMPGVRAVVSAADVPDCLAGWLIQDTPLFARDWVRYEGEAIAAVAADTLQQAREALDVIMVTIEEEPPIESVEAALVEGAALVHPDLAEYAVPPGIAFNRNGNVACHFEYAEDGYEEAFRDADRVVEDVYELGRQYQAYMEPKSAIATFRNGRFHIETGHQYVFNLRDRLSQFLQVSASDIQIKGQIMGGGFGGKLDFGPEPYAAVLSRAAGGRPVKLVFSRAEDILVGTSRESTRVRIRSALDADGNIIGREFETDHDNGAYSGELPLLAGVALSFCKGVYRAGPFRTRYRLVYTNTTPTGAFRGVSGVPIITAVESHMDHIADELGEDRREFRLRHMLKDGESLPNGQVLGDISILEEGFARLEEKVSWKQEMAAKKPLEGIGITSVVWITNPLPATATVKLSEDGSAQVVSGTCDIGTGAMAQGVVQVVADVLGLAPDKVHIPLPDTDVAAHDGGSQGSRTTRAVGKAAMDAAKEVRRKVLETAAPLMQCDAVDLDMNGETVFNKDDPGLCIPLTDILMMASVSSGAIAATATYADKPTSADPGRTEGLAFPVIPTPTYHVHFAKVAVCPVTGNVEVLKYVLAQEVGAILNPQGIMGQVQGGVAQGIGYALYESLRLEGARYLDRSLEACHLPLAVDVPDVEAILMEHPDDHGPHGAKGAAEPSIVLAPAAIHNAVADAIGVRINKFPISPEDILEALESRGI